MAHNRQQRTLDATAHLASTSSPPTPPSTPPPPPPRTPPSQNIKRYVVHREPFCLASEALQLAALLAGAGFCDRPLPAAAAGMLRLVVLASCGGLFYIQVG